MVAGPITGPGARGVQPGHEAGGLEAREPVRTRQEGLEAIGGMEGVLGAQRAVPVERQAAEDAPGAGAQARSWRQKVGDFFQRAGQSIARTATRAFEGLAGGIAGLADRFANWAAGQARQNAPAAQAHARQQPAAPALDPHAAALERTKNAALQEGIELLGDNLAEAYVLHQEEFGPIPIADFVALKMPAPEGDLDPESAMNIAQRLEIVGDRVANGDTEARTEMRQAVLARFELHPDLSIAMDVAFGTEMQKLDVQATTFLRLNSAYTKLEMVLSRESLPVRDVNSSLLGPASQAMGARDLDRIVEGRTIQRNAMTAPQREAVEAAGDRILTDLLDTSAETQGSYLNSIPQEFRDHLSDKAEQILAKDNLSAEARTTAVRHLYMNTLFLRGQSSELAGQIVTSQDLSRPEKAILAAANKEILAMLNGVERAGAGGEQSNAALAHFHAGHGARVDAFLAAVGMPTLAEET